MVGAGCMNPSYMNPERSCFPQKSPEWGLLAPQLVSPDRAVLEAPELCLRRSELALNGRDEPGQSSWPASQPPPPKRGGQSVCSTRCFARCVHMPIKWLFDKAVSDCAVPQSPRSVKAVAVGPN